MNPAVATPLPVAAAATPAIASAKLEEFQLLRALAAAMVVWGHAFDWSEAAGTQGEWPAGWKAVGAAGVDLFFIISGFIIARTAFLVPSSPAPAEFMARRLLRIVPLYWWWSGIVYLWQTSAGNAFPAAAVAKTFLIVPGVELHGYVLPVLYLGWTLSYELMFYGGVGLGLALGLRRPEGVIAVAVALAAASCFVRSPVAWLPFLANPLWLEFAAGMGLALVYPALTRVPRWGGGLMAGAGVAVWAMSAHAGAAELARIAATLDNTLSHARVLAWGGGALLVAVGTIVALGGGAVRLPRLCVRLGDASYTWYLSQAVTLPVAALVWRRLVGWEAELPFTFFAVGLTGGAALLLAHALEFPFHRWATAWARRRFRVAARAHPTSV